MANAKARAAEEYKRKCRELDRKFKATHVSPFNRTNDDGTYEYPEFREAVVSRNQNLETLLLNEHPKKDIIENWTIPEDALKPPSSQVNVDYFKSEKWVGNEEQFTDMLNHLRRAPIFSVDVEMTRYKGYQGPFIALLQFGTFS